MKITIPSWIIKLKDNIIKTKDIILDNDNNLTKDNKALFKKIKKTINKTYTPSSSGFGISGFVMSIVGFAVTLAVGLIVLGQLKASVDVNSAAYNATDTITQNMLTQLPNWIGVIVTVILAFIVLGYFYKR